MFEITEYRDEYEMNQAIATFTRNKTMADTFVIHYEFNPPPLRSHWIYA